MSSDVLVFFVNGKKVSECSPDPNVNLLQYLRNRLRLTGSKPSCGQGGCGACTVMLSHFDRDLHTIVHRAVVACILPLCAVHGCAITTVEGVGSCRAGLHSIQTRLVQQHGIQCGFCTPGMVMSMYALLHTNPTPTSDHIDRAIEGNLCRCTGYRPIWESLNTFSKEYQCSLGEECCRNKKSSDSSDSGEAPAEFVSYDPTQEPIFPAELQVCDTYDRASVRFAGPEVTWYRPVRLSELLALRKLHPSASLIAGFTGSAGKGAAGGPSVVVSLSHVTELGRVAECETGLVIGGSVTLSRLESVLTDTIKRHPETRTKHFAALSEMVRRFGSQQIRNMATLGGSVMQASSYSDVIVILVASGAVVTVVTSDGCRRNIPLDSKFFPSNKRTILEKNEVLLHVTLPFSHKDDIVCGYKQANRRTFDLAVVNAGLYLSVDGEEGMVKAANFCFGGLGPSFTMAQGAVKAIVGRKLEDATTEEIIQILEDELGGMTDYRRTLAAGFLFKFVLAARMELVRRGVKDAHPVDPVIASASQRCHRGPTQGKQIYEEVPADQPQDDPIGRPIPHVTTNQMSTGEAGFTTDMRKVEGELFLALVKSTKAHARILEVDPSAALGMPGVVGYVDRHDVPGSNMTGMILQDEPIFAEDEVSCHSQVIGGIVADTEQQARRAASVVHVTYEELPVVTTIEEAISQGLFYESPKLKVEYGDVARGLEEADHVIEGEVRIANQDHYYMETQGCLVVPSGEADEIEAFLGTQHCAGAQRQIAGALGIPSHKVFVKSKRSGGAFGGKESRGTMTIVLLPSAVAAVKFGRPVRCSLTREEDITMTGNRHPYLAKYKVGFSQTGKLQTLDCHLYNNGGSVTEQSISVGRSSQLCVDVNYKFENARVRVDVCRTNTPSPTAMRGYGRPQAMLVTENIVTAVADKLGLAPETVRDINLYAADDQHLRLPIGDGLRRCWDQVREDSQFDTRRQHIIAYNKANRWKKRGISMIPAMFGLLFPISSMNQGGALVNVYKDGSVLLTHGGAEVGQGLYTKMIMIASRVLGVPMNNIHTAETSTTTVPNQTNTAGSTGSDLFGPAVLDACQKIKAKVEPYRTANPSGSWSDWVMAAYLDRVHLSATGFFRPDPSIPNADDWLKGTGPMFLYYTYGAGCTEVEIDCLTGDHVVLRTDIVMDVGRSLNSAIDIGQIEGAFVQGMGMLTIEEIQIREDGYMKTRGPGTYKIPTMANIPAQFNVALLKGSSNPRAIYSSKGIGEPPLLLSSTVFFAIKDAIKAARADGGILGDFRLDSPATAERIRMACVDRFTKQATGTADFVPVWRA